MDRFGSLAEMRAIGVREQWLIEHAEVTALPGRVLGTGGFGVVVEGLYHNTPVALKIPRQDIQINLVHESLPALCNELRILRRLRHPNIVFLYGATMDEHHASCDSASCTPTSSSSMRLCLVLEHIDGVLLRHFIRAPEVAGGDSGGGTLTRPPRSSTVSINERTQIVFDILNALRYLHSRTPTVVHGDLKDSNIFVQQLCLNGGTVARAKLLDFGLARLLTRSAEPLGGTTRWRAPELFGKSRVRPDCAADVYSAGLLMFLIVTGTPPFQDVRAKEMARRRVRKRPLFLSWPDDRGDLQSLQCWCVASVERCTQVWPEQRPSVEAVCDELSRGLDILGRVGAREAEDDGPVDLRLPGTEPRPDDAPDPNLAPVPEGARGRDTATLAHPPFEPAPPSTRYTL
jgi:serine/threonine protein kinase